MLRFYPQGVIVGTTGSSSGTELRLTALVGPQFKGNRIFWGAISFLLSPALVKHSFAVGILHSAFCVQYPPILCPRKKPPARTAKLAGTMSWQHRSSRRFLRPAPLSVNNANKTAPKYPWHTLCFELCQ